MSDEEEREAILRYKNGDRRVVRLPRSMHRGGALPSEFTFDGVTFHLRDARYYVAIYEEPP